MNQTLSTTPVLIAGGGPVGMTLALELAFHGVASILVERRPSTTKHPKMDLTNGRSMELFRRLGIVEQARAAGVAEDQKLDITYATSATGYRLHTFDYGSPAQQREIGRRRNDGRMTLEPPMRVSQVMLEPVLKKAIDESPLVDVRFGWVFEDFTQDHDGVTSTIRCESSGENQQVRSRFLAGCDGGSSKVRKVADIEVEGEWGVVPVYLVHFESTDHTVLAKFGAAYHLQTGFGTLIAQNGRNIWTLHVVLPPGTDIDAIKPEDLLRQFAGRDFEFEILVANHWTPHMVVAEKYRDGNVFLAGDAAHQFVPTGGYGMNTGIADAVDLGWKLSAVVNEWGGEKLLASVTERHVIALQNRVAAMSNMTERFTIEAYIQEIRATIDLDSSSASAQRLDISNKIQEIGNAENESWGIEHGYQYADSEIIEYPSNLSEQPAFDRLHVNPSFWPGSRLPLFYLESDGRALFDLLGRDFTLIALGDADTTEIETAAAKCDIPMAVVRINKDKNLEALGKRLVLVRPDQHIAWSGNKWPEDSKKLLLKVCGKG
ncbi:FAD-dependent monooxygenase [Zhongshania guokunii]|uniref:FAD-dependent monooxygenase n=1 Tax=Zhongshania guokunii TaxID=641783 RepID=A0ABV3UAD4_9GAMM